MREEAKLWLEDARYDLESAQDLFASERYNYAVWLPDNQQKKRLKRRI